MVEKDGHFLLLLLLFLLLFCLLLLLLVVSKRIEFRKRVCLCFFTIPPTRWASTPANFLQGQATDYSLPRQRWFLGNSGSLRPTSFVPIFIEFQWNSFYHRFTTLYTSLLRI